MSQGWRSTKETGEVSPAVKERNDTEGQEDTGQTPRDDAHVKSLVEPRNRNFSTFYYKFDSQLNTCTSSKFSSPLFQFLFKVIKLLRLSCNSQHARKRGTLCDSCYLLFPVFKNTTPMAMLHRLLPPPQGVCSQSSSLTTEQFRTFEGMPSSSVAPLGPGASFLLFLELTLAEHCASIFF